MSRTRWASNRSRTTATALLLALALTGGCTTLTEPERPAYNGVDQVGDFAPERLVGTWRVTELNPFSDQAEQDTVIEYRADGSVTGRVDLRDEGGSLLGGEGARFEVNGRWSVENGIVSHSDVAMEVVSGGTFARLLGRMVDGASGLGGRTDVHELGADHIVMLGSDGAAMRYDRL